MVEVNENLKGGFYLVNKPATWTSFDIVKKIKFQTKIKKIGHAGTLDPLAEGLLIICFGKHTKKIEEFQALSKVYEGIMEFGKTTPSIDLETEFDLINHPVSHINQEKLNTVANQFLGEIIQTPPIYSAVKKDGKRLYELARKGIEEKDLTIKKRIVKVHKIDLTISEFPQVNFRIECSKGTYIRSIVRDIGIALNSGAYMKYLNRIQIGEYHVANAQEINHFDPAKYESIL